MNDPAISGVGRQFVRLSVEIENLINEIAQLRQELDKIKSEVKGTE